jgi:hypothetical protein
MYTTCSLQIRMSAFFLNPGRHKNPFFQFLNKSSFFQTMFKIYTASVRAYRSSKDLLFNYFFDWCKFWTLNSFSSRSTFGPFSECRFRIKNELNHGDPDLKQSEIQNGSTGKNTVSMYVFLA